MDQEPAAGAVDDGLPEETERIEVLLVDSSRSKWRRGVAAASPLWTPVGDTSSGRSRRAISKARSRACGSARSCIQPCSSHSRMAPASFSTLIAQPRGFRIVGSRGFSRPNFPPGQVLGWARTNRRAVFRCFRYPSSGGCSLSVLRVRLSPHRALVNRAAQRLGRVGAGHLEEDIPMPPPKPCGHFSMHTAFRTRMLSTGDGCTA